MSFTESFSARQLRLQFTLGFILFVQIITQIDAISIQIDPGISPITVSGGQQTTSLKCYVTYSPQTPTITWTIGNREIGSHWEVTTATSSFGMSITTELRYNFQSYDHGQTITCMARLPDGTWVSSYSQLNVVQTTSSAAAVTPRPNTTSKKNLPSELRGINWSQHIDEYALLRLPSGQAVPAGFTVGRPYYLGFGQPNLVYQTCVTPRSELGKCRFLHHCARPQIIVSLGTFLSYACPIGNDFMGVCCPETDVAPVPKIPSPPLPITTRPPTTKPPSLPKTIAQSPLKIATTTKISVTKKVPVAVSSTTGRTTKAPTTKAPPRTAATTQPSSSNTKKGCGELIKQTSRIVGGSPADPGEWPWMAALLRDKTDQYCGGVLITDQHVLTASHCVYRWKPGEVTVRLGEYDFSKASKWRKDFAVDAIFVHEEYNSKSQDNDIALIRLKEKIGFNSMIWPICLPPSNLDYSVLEGESAYVAGWGTTSYSGHPSDILLELLVPIWKMDDCKKSSNRRPITDKQMCAGYKQGGRDSCQGDSGGPLMYQSASGRWAVVGIVSWGHRCAEKNHPGVYARVPSYANWIRAKVLA